MHQGEQATSVQHCLSGVGQGRIIYWILLATVGNILEMKSISHHWPKAYLTIMQ